MNAERIVSLNLDTLVAAMEARTATRTRAKSWGWLCEQSSVCFVDDALVVESATWSQTTYLATPDTCSCPAKGHCWHKESAAIVAAALAEDARYDLEADNAAWRAAYDASSSPYHAIAHHEATEALHAARAERKARAYADVQELFA